VFTVKEPVLFTKNKKSNTTDTEADIKQKLVDIEILRSKLDKKEAELKKLLESS
jgi:hypothetical protein